MKKAGIIALASAAAVLAAGAVILTRSEGGENEPKTAERVTVLALEDAETIEVKAEGLEAKYIKESGVWLPEGCSPSDVSAAKMSAFIGFALVYDAELVIEEPQDLDEYGLDAPSCTVAVTARDGEHTVLIGNKSAVDDVYFASADGAVFTMSAAQRDALMTDPKYFTEFKRLEINPDDVTEIKITSAERTIDLYLPEITRLEGNVWRMREPYEHMANDSFIDAGVLDMLGSITLSRLADGIGGERARLSITEGGKHHEFGIGAKDGGDVYVEYENRAYAEPAELFEFVDADTFEYINKLVSYVNIRDITELDAEYGGKTHVLGVVGGKTLSYTADGEPADADAAERLYGEVIGVVANGFYKGEPAAETILKLTFRGASGDTRVEYRRTNEYTAAVFVNGSALFVTGAVYAENVKSALEGFFEGGNKNG